MRKSLTIIGVAICPPSQCWRLCRLSKQPVHPVQRQQSLILSLTRIVKSVWCQQTSHRIWPRAHWHYAPVRVLTTKPSQRGVEFHHERHQFDEWSGASSVMVLQHAGACYSSTLSLWTTNAAGAPVIVLASGGWGVNASVGDDIYQMSAATTVGVGAVTNQWQNGDALYVGNYGRPVMATLTGTGAVPSTSCLRITTVWVSKENRIVKINHARMSGDAQEQPRILAFNQPGQTKGKIP